MSTTTTQRYGSIAIGVASRAHVVSTTWLANHVLPGVKPSFMDATAHRRFPEVLLT